MVFYAQVQGPPLYDDNKDGIPWDAGSLGKARDAAIEAGVWQNKNEVTLVSWHTLGGHPAGIAWMATLCTDLGVHTCGAYVWKGMTAQVGSPFRMKIFT